MWYADLKEFLQTIAMKGERYESRENKKKMQRKETVHASSYTDNAAWGGDDRVRGEYIYSV